MAPANAPIIAAHTIDAGHIIIAARIIDAGTHIIGAACHQGTDGDNSAKGDIADAGVDVIREGTI